MWKELWHEHRGGTLGLAGGLLLGFIYLFVGFWDMLMFAFIVFLTFLVGKYYDRLDAFLQLLLERYRDRHRGR